MNIIVFIYIYNIKELFYINYQYIYNIYLYINYDELF